HTVQQSQGPVSGTPSAGGVSISDPSDSYEQAAESSADNVMAGALANAQRMASSEGPASVQRAAEDEEKEEPAQAMRTSTYTANVQRAAEDEEKEEPAQAMRTSTYTASIQRAAE